MDFTINRYKSLLKSLKDNGYEFQNFADFIINPSKAKVVILRHDVDKLPENSLNFAYIQNTLNISGSYYFRAVKESWDEKIIKKIENLGHEVGYHYETMDTSSGNIDSAWIEFKYHLKELRKLVKVKTICMHGSPLSSFDNRDIWNKYNYKELNLIGEPYFDINFDNVFYLTDTGRRWDGRNVSIRDKVKNQINPNNNIFHSTADIINSIEAGDFPEKVMFNFHPQRWNSNLFLWIKEFTLQNIKNIIKYLLIKFR